MLSVKEFGRNFSWPLYEIFAILLRRSERIPWWQSQNGGGGLRFVVCKSHIKEKLMNLRPIGYTNMIIAF
jgi:hypothetical protein